MTDDVLDLDFIEKMLSLTLPPNTVAKAGWRLDHKAIVAAVEVLKLSRAVKIRFTSGGEKRESNGGRSSATYGCHQIKLDRDKNPMEFYHGITLSQIRTFEDANMTLWHEFRHAWQAESFARVSGKSIEGFYRIYKNASGPHGESYKQNKFELDARAFAKMQVDAGKYLLIPKVTKSVDDQINDLTDLEQFITDNAHPEWED